MRILLLIGYAVFVAVVSLRPASGVSIDPWDKLLHFITYALFAGLAYLALGRGRGFLVCCVAIMLYGGLMEVGQSFMPGRVMSGYDFLANALGVLAVILLIRRLDPSRVER